MGRSTPRARTRRRRRSTKKLNESSGHASPSRLVPRRATDGDGDEAESKKCDEDFSLGTPKKRSLETGGALNASVWEANGEATETEMEPETEDDEGEERTHVDIVSSPKFRRIHARVDRKSDEELSKLVSSPMPRALSESVELERTLSREMNERRGVNTPDMVNEGNNGVSSERSKTPWTATPDASLPIGLKPADRARHRARTVSKHFDESSRCQGIVRVPSSDANGRIQLGIRKGCDADDGNSRR